MRVIALWFVLLIVGIVYAQEPITIVSYTPQPDTVDTRTDTDITIVFSRPVVPLVGTTEQAALPSPVVMEPAVEGIGTWLNTLVWRFEATVPLPLNTTFTLRTDDTFQPVDGSALRQESWQFTTPMTRVTNFYVKNSDEYGMDANTPISPVATFTLYFSEPITSRIAESIISLSTADGIQVPLTIEFGNNTREVFIMPTNPLAIASDYVLSVQNPANGVNVLQESFIQSLRTEPFPYVKEVFPLNESAVSVEGFGSTTIHFATPMNLDTLRDRIVVEPASVEWEPVANTNDNKSLRIAFQPEIGTRYTITLLAGSEDLYGNRIDMDYTWSFSGVTPPPPPVPALDSRFILWEGIAVTGAHRENTRLAMATNGDQDFISNMSLYTATPEDVVSFKTTLNTVDTADAINPNQVIADNAPLLRSWQQTFNGEGGRIVSQVLLASTDGGRLSPGLYWFIANEYLNRYGGTENPIQQRRILLAVSSAVVTVQRNPDGVLVWVTDMVTTRPLADVLVTAYTADGDSIAALTNDDGTAWLNRPIAYQSEHEYEYWVSDYLFITATGSGIYGAWSSDYVNPQQDKIGYLYTERPLYRPGETVYFRGILRDRNDMNFETPSVKSINVSLCGQYDYECDLPTETISVPVSYWGTVNGNFVLPETLEPGRYSIHTDWGRGAFSETKCYSWGSGKPYCDTYSSNGTGITVATFDTPEYEISAAPLSPEGIQGNDLGVLVNASFYSGGGVRDAQVTWYPQYSSIRFQHENYNFYDASREYYEWERNLYYPTEGDEETAVKTDGAGNAIIRLDRLVVSVPMRVFIDANVTEGGNTRATSTSFIVHSSAVYVGLRTASRIIEPGINPTIEMIAVSPFHEPVADQVIEFTVEHIRWERTPSTNYGYYDVTPVITPIMSGEVTTNDEGSATMTFATSELGKYRIRTRTTDGQGNTHSSTLDMWVSGGQIESPDNQQFSPSLRIIADKDEYLPGDTARLLIEVPSSGRLLLNVQRFSVMRQFIVSVEAGTESITFDLPLSNDDTPNIYVWATFIQGTEQGNASLASTSINLIVKPIHRELFVEVTPSTLKAAPGEIITFDILVTDRVGAPIRAEVGLALVDDAILSLVPPANGTLMQTFYRHQPNRVFVSNSLYGLIDALTDSVSPGGMGGGGGGGGNDPLSASLDTREDYETTPLWLPNVVTDENGRASVSVIMPDNLTRWRLDARVVSLSTLVGQTETSLVTSLPFFLRPQTPRFLVVGDEVELAMFINNNTNTDQTVTTSIGVTGVTLLDPMVQDVTIPANSQKRVGWRAKVDDVEAVDVTFYAANDAVQDAAKPDLPNNQIPILTYSAPDTVATAGILDNAEAYTEFMRVPEKSLATTLDITLNSSLVTTTLATLDAYPALDYETTHRLLSRLTLYVAAYKYAPSKSLREQIEQAITTLDTLQTSYKGWVWIPGQGYNDELTTYHVMIALGQAIEAGFTGTTETMLNKACSSNLFPIYSLSTSSSESQINRVVLGFYAQSYCEDGTSIAQEMLIGYRSRMNPNAKAYLLLATLRLLGTDHPTVELLVDDLLGSNIVTATGVHWQDTDAQSWGTDTSATALTLQALLKVIPDNPLLPNVVRWLVIARRGDTWQTPIESAAAVVALLDYASVNERGRANYAYDVSLNDVVLATAVAPTSEERLSFPLTSTESTLSITRDQGNGVLYYTATMNAELSPLDTIPVSRGIIVLREYLNVAGEPITSIALGESVFVRLTLITDQDLFFFVMEDYVPAGLVADDPSLITSDTDRLSVSRSLNSTDYRWYYNASQFARSVYRDDRVLFYANSLPQGTYVVTYEARADSVGTFQVMPTHAYAAFMPDIFGRTGGQLFTVSNMP